jgi:TonB-dependent SusC/RagA subfamily outer membrane receptor
MFLPKSELGATVVRFVRSTIMAAAAVTAIAAVSVAPLTAQETGSIAGRVISNTGQPLSEVVITIVGTERTGLTNAEGRYLILGVPAGSYEVTAQYIGFGEGTQQVEIAAGGSAVADFTLQTRAVQLEGVVVTGTAIAAQRREVGNSIDLITSADIEAQGVTSVEEILRGRIQGLTISGTNATPGAGAEINIRGVTSINGRTTPLIYVDGARVGSENGSFEDAGLGTGAATVLQSISPNDIERIEVIKGAAASTLYGTDATAGVIQIFTKRGNAAQQAQWTVSSQTSLTQPSIFGPGEDIDPTGMHLNRCDINGPLPQDTIPGPDPDCPASGSWLKNAVSQNTSLQVRGGTDGFSYFASGGYQNQQGIVNAPSNHPGAFAENVFLRSNFTFDPFQSLQVQLNTAYTNREISFVPDGSTTIGLAYNVTRLTEGETNEDRDAQVFDRTQLQRIDQFTISSTLNWTPMDNMRHRFNAGFDWSNSNQRSEFKAGHFIETAGERTVDIENNRVITLDYAGSYFFEIPQLPMLAFTTSWGGQLNDREASGLRSDSRSFINRGNTVIQQGGDLFNSTEDRRGFINGGFFAQQQIGINNQLFITGGFRFDSFNSVNERLEAEPQYQFFPKLQAAYTVSDHLWWPADLIETFRLRAAWGEAGDPPNATSSRTLWDTRETGRGNLGFVVNQIGNTNLEAERTGEWEIGADISALQGRVNVSGQYFRRETTGGIVDNDPIPSLGIIEPTAFNAGEWASWGYEATVDVNILDTRDFRWNVNTSYQYLDNEIIGIGRNATGEIAFDPGTGTSGFRPGFPFPGIFRERILNADQRGELPQYSDSAEFIGINFPPQEISISTTVGIGSRLTLDLFGYGQFGHIMLDNQALTLAEDGLWPACIRTNELMDAWRLAGSPEDAVPNELTALDIARCDAQQNPDTRDWYDGGDFFRFSSASLQYRVPEDWLPSAIKGATIQAQALNLNLWTDFAGTDPDAIRGAGSQQRARETGFLLPLPRTYQLNVRLNF